MIWVARTACRVAAGVAALTVVLAGAGCGGESPRRAEPGSSTTVLAATTSAPGPAATTVPIATTVPTATTAPAPGPGTVPPTSQLGPEWTQRDGRVLIEAAASGDPQQLLADLVALGLTDGVVAGRLVNGWLPVAAVPAAQRLDSLQFIRPTGAGTG